MYGLKTSGSGFGLRNDYRITVWGELSISDWIIDDSVLRGFIEQ